MRKALIILVGIFVFFGIAFAIDGAGVEKVDETRWSGSLVAASDTTEGGNLTVANLTTTTLTGRWAEYSGNVSGYVILGDGNGNTVYNWTVGAATAGKVCASTASSFAFATVANLTDVATVDTVWGFGSAVDNATNTYTSTECDITFSQGAVLSTYSAVLKGSSTFRSCAVTDGSTAGKSNFAFCTTINDTATGRNFNDSAVNYELLVPTAFGSTEKYYFYVQLS